MAATERRQGEEIYRFGRVTVDTRRGALQVNGKGVELRSQSFEVLKILVQNEGKLVSRRSLLDAVWGNVAVTDDSLTQCLADIRRVLDDTDKKIVRTVPRRGYIFNGDLLAPGEQRQSIADHLLGNRLAAVAAIVAIAVVSWLAWQRPATTESANGKASIAVLPFVDMTAEQDQRFLGHGIAEEILNFLAQSEDLRVIARTSSFAFEGTGADIETIGRKLSVTHILEGSVRHGGDQLRITTKLVNARNNSPVWSQSYDRPTGNILGIESDIAHSVAEALQAQLDLQQTTTPGPNPYAHALIIEARSFNRLFGAGGHEVAERMLLEALEIDPDNVAALTELARSAFFGRGAEGSSGRDAAWQRSIALTNRALEIDPQDAVANAWRGYHEIHYFGDFAAGARYLERAMESDPAHSDVIGVVINACLFFGQYDLAIALGKFVMLRDPLCVSCAGSLATNAMLQGDFELAETTIRQQLELVPFLRGVRSNLANILLWKGDAQGALAQLDQFDDLNAGDLRTAAIANYRLGNMDAYQHFRRELIDKHGETNPESVAALEAETGNVDTAFVWLEKNLAQPPWDRGYNIGSPEFAILHDNPRWNTLLRQLGLSPEQRASIDFDPRLPF